MIQKHPKTEKRWQFNLRLTGRIDDPVAPDRVAECVRNADVNSDDRIVAQHSRGYFVTYQGPSGPGMRTECLGARNTRDAIEKARAMPRLGRLLWEHWRGLGSDPIFTVLEEEGEL